MRHILREGVYKPVTENKLVKAPLEGRACDMCGELYVVGTREWRGFRITGIFNDAPSHRHGNMFDIEICSFRCAQTVWDGGWRKLERYADYNLDRIDIERAEVVEMRKQCSVAEAQRRWDESENGYIRNEV